MNKFEFAKEMVEIVEMAAVASAAIEDVLDIKLKEVLNKIEAERNR